MEDEERESAACLSCVSGGEVRVLVSISCEDP